MSRVESTRVTAQPGAVHSRSAVIHSRMTPPESLQVGMTQYHTSHESGITLLLSSHESRSHKETVRVTSCFRDSSIMKTESHLLFTSLRGCNSGTLMITRLPLLSFAVNQLRPFPSLIKLRNPSLCWSEDHKRQTILRACLTGSCLMLEDHSLSLALPSLLYKLASSGSSKSREGSTLLSHDSESSLESS
jgi:hypothetical protein